MPRKLVARGESPTIAEGLLSYGIGGKLRRLRLRKSMGLVELARHTGLSPAMLSKLERDRLHPTLPTLLRIAMVFGVGLEYFFNLEPKPVFEIVRRKDRLRFPESPDAKSPAYFFESLDFPASNRPLSSYFAEFADTSAEGARPHSHRGIELLYLLSGKLAICAGGTRHLLAAGDSVYFDSSVPHSYTKVGAARTTALVVAFAPSG